MGRAGATRQATSRLRLLPSLIILALLPGPCGPVAGFLPLTGERRAGPPAEVLGETETASPTGGPANTERGGPPGPGRPEPPTGGPGGTTPDSFSGDPEAVERRVAPQDFRLSGTITTPLVPGARRALDVVIENLDGYPLEVTAISVSFAGPVLGADGRVNPGCRVDGLRPDLVVVRNFVGPVTVPPRTALSLSALAVPEDRWPLLAMLNRPVNQDGCRNSVFPLVLTGAGRVE